MQQRLRTPCSQQNTPLYMRRSTDGGVGLGNHFKIVLLNTYSAFPSGITWLEGVGVAGASGWLEGSVGHRCQLVA